ncbi:GatB/YqeY domain-containing protein [Bacillus velezensis]|uniref:GatB/YqeY domain-containing protein n=1 Tax=Bacillus velezensis TaxID=492670 RepID=UPI0018C51281|nr:GatB/YqeY domain-containing protein [Bacillus velezensis]QPK89693.1 GatB/YqeY domain-containing protein [Bacillus velezensis]
MNKLIDQIKKDRITAMKSGDKEKLSTLRLLISKLEKEKVTNKLTDISELSDEQAERVVVKSIRELDKEIEAYKNVNRDTASQEVEKELLSTYLPKPLTIDELKAVVREIATKTAESGKNIGLAMKQLKSAIGSRADMGTASKMLKEELNKQGEQ